MNNTLKRIAGWMVLGGLAFWLVVNAGPHIAALAQYAAVAAAILGLHARLVPNSEVTRVWRRLRRRSAKN